MWTAGVAELLLSAFQYKSFPEACFTVPEKSAAKQRQSGSFNEIRPNIMFL